ncbi:D-xylose-proton symporter [Pirellulimonas nuda]|uniref:D-xylose-proton symporter n=2 Tax=Pirellulimonas nuda TaxID=2528009 RepID=A0A518D984_9BACT|nr:D-xylose-proton symporter [Pirellulimonas nuda]
MKLSGKLLASAVTASLGGFLFGFDTVVISGAEQKIQSIWGLSDWLHGMATSSALWGTVLGALAGGVPTDRFGRKATLTSIGMLYFVSAVWSGLATDVYTFALARFIGGVGVGISTVAAPLYITEIAPAEFRGRLTGMFQFNIVLGILIAFLSNAMLENVGENNWRWMLGIEAIPALAYTLLCLRIPESPRWLINIRGDRDAGRAVLGEVNPEADAQTLDAMAASIAHHVGEDATHHNVHTPFWSRRLMRPIMLAFLVAFFNQMSGINAVLYYAPRILGMTGLGEQAAQIRSVGIGVTNLVFTMLGLWLIDRLGRRTLLVIGSVGYIASLGVISATFYANATPFGVAADALAAQEAYKSLATAESAGDVGGEKLAKLQEDAAAARKALALSSAGPEYQGEPAQLPADDDPRAVADAAGAAARQASSLAGSGGLIVLIGIFAFIAAHAVGQGAVIWVLISEVFPNEHRASGQAFGSGTHWVFAALITLLFPPVVRAFPAGAIFAFFCGMMALQLVWVLTMVPETKGVPLEELQRKLGVE